jgi:hypothetical protein
VLKPRPWEEQIKARQIAIRRAWLAAAEALEQPKQSILYKKEPHNDRPDYERLDAGRIRTGGGLVPVSAAVYQSRLEKPGFQKQAIAIAGLRNMSSIGLVHEQGPIEMLLRPNARHRVGQPGRGAADHDLRRTRAGDYGNAGAAKQIGRDQATIIDDKALAERIRGFVAGMPGIDTQRYEIRRKLLERFGHAPARSHEAGAKRPETRFAAPAPESLQDKGLER